jgi:basic amino acid/polyamine antiporter, APA family
VLASDRELVRGLSFTSTTALVIGSIIGTGVFFKAAIMAQQVGSPALVLAAWVVAGLLSLVGALTFAELGGMLPHAGGEYVYLRMAYGDGPAFLCGWMRLVVSSGGVAALGVGFATFLSAVIPLNEVWLSRTFTVLGRTMRWQFGLKESVAIVVILLLGFVNCLGVVLGGRLQTALTAAKVLGILAIVAGAFLFSGHTTPATPMLAGIGRWSGLQSFGAAMLSALWAYDGWAYMPMAAAEVQDADRNVPRALILGALLVLALYGLANLAYFWALPFAEIATANSTNYRNALPVAAKAARTFLGARGPAIASLLFMISAGGALNGVIMTTARIPFAMARDGLFFSQFGKLSDACVPARAILVLAFWSAVLAISGTFDQLTDMTVFGMWVFYGLTASTIFVLRRKMPDAPRPYRALGYPVVPIVFVLVALWLLGNTLMTSTVESITGLVLIGIGYPLYLRFRPTKSKGLDVSGAAGR